MFDQIQLSHLTSSSSPNNISHTCIKNINHPCTDVSLQCNICNIHIFIKMWHNRLDFFSRYTWIYFRKSKFEALDTFLKFKFMVELQFNTKIKTIQSDGGGEFQTISKYLLSQGITHHKSCSHTPEQNGTIERKIRHIVETGLTLLATASLPLKFWDEAFYIATLLINKLPTLILSFKTPFEKLFHKQHDYSSLRVFLCSCFPLLKPYHKYKMNFKSKECTFIGYSPLSQRF